MTDQRSAFRFRIPRLRPPVPPPSPITQNTATRPPLRQQQLPSQRPTRPQVDPSPRPPPRPQGTEPRPPPASALPSPPPIRPQGTAPAQPLPVVQQAPQAALASPPQPLPSRPQDTTPARLPVVQPTPQAALASPLPLPPIQPQGTAPARQPAPSLTVTPEEPTALPPTVPVHPLGTVPASPPEPVAKPSTAPQDEPALSKTPSPAPSLPPTVPLHPLGTVPASPPVEQSAAIAPQDEPASTTRKPTQVAPSSPLNSSIMPKLKTTKPQKFTKTESQPSSPSQTTIQSRFTSPPSPSRVSSKSPPHSQPPSPPRVHPSQPPSSPLPQVKRSTDITSNNGQRGADPILKAAPTTETNEELHEEAFMDLSSVHSNSEPHIRDQQRIRKEKKQHESEDAASTSSNVPNKPQTKSMISLPEDKIQEPESPNNQKLNEPQTPYCEDTTGTNLKTHHLNEKSPSVITLAGQNRGTSMHIRSGATKRHWKIHIHRKYKVNPDEITDTTTDGEENSKEKKRGNDLIPNEDKDKNAYVNCNVQGINNSMVFNCFIKERNPGVHRGSSSIPLRKPKRNKVKVNITPSQSSKQTIRRRCLRGLFMESSSESDPNHPQKPRRHGCRYNSDKDDKMDVV